MILSFFDGVFGQLGFEASEGGVAGGLKVGLGSLRIGELGLGNEPSAIRFDNNKINVSNKILK